MKNQITKSTEKQLDDHIKKADSRFSSIEGKIDLMTNNHLHTLDIDMQEVKVNQKWLKEGFNSLKGRLWWIAGLILGGGVLTDILIQ